MAELNFYRILLLITSFSGFEIIDGGEWVHEYNSWYYTVTSMPDTVVPNGTLVSEMKASPSVTACSYFCSRSESVSFYYNKVENRCFCDNFDARLTVDNQIEDASSDINYGSITSSVQVILKAFNASKPIELK